MMDRFLFLPLFKKLSVLVINPEQIIAAPITGNVGMT